MIKIRIIFICSREVDKVPRNLRKFLIRLCLRCMRVFEGPDLQTLIRIKSEITTLWTINERMMTWTHDELTKSSTWTVFLGPLWAWFSTHNSYEHINSHNWGNRFHIICNAFTECLRCLPSQFENTVNMEVLSSTECMLYDITRFPKLATNQMRSKICDNIKMIGHILMKRNRTW